MTAPKEDLQSGPIEHLHRAVDHGLGVLRCYVAMLAAESWRFLDKAQWVLLATGIGLMGVALFTFGAAQWIERRIGTPGSGAMIVGIGLMGLSLAIAWMRARRKEQGP